MALSGLNSRVTLWRHSDRWGARRGEAERTRLWRGQALAQH